MSKSFLPQEQSTPPTYCAPEPEEQWSGDWADPFDVAMAMGNSYMSSQVCEDPGLSSEPDLSAPMSCGPTPEEEEAEIDAALEVANGKLSTGWLDWWVTDDEANGAVDALSALPPDLQGRAIEKMDKGTFDTMLSEVSTMDKTKFKSLFENTHDPERKLKLWAEYHKGQVATDAELEHQKTADDGGWWPFNDTKEQKENDRLNKRRDEIVSTTNKEIDDEVKVAMEQLAAGKLTEADINAIAARKDKEHKIEMKFNVNLVNDEGKRRDGNKLAWSENELGQIENALARMPEDHVKHNSMLKEIRRSEMAQRGGVDKPNIGGDHSDGVIRIYDTGISGLYRHTNDQPESVDTNNSTNTRLTPLEETIVHEVGHDVHDQNSEAFTKFKAAVGWQESMTDAQVTNAGISAADLAALKAGTKSTVVVNGKVYQVDPYHTNQDGTPRFVAYDEGSIPSTAQGAQPNQTYGHDTWSYARTNPMDHFAETYQKAVHMPETLAKDLLDAPQNRVNVATATRDAFQASLDGLKAKQPPATPEEIKAAEDALKAQQATLDDARKDQTAQQSQWDIMRKDIFHTDKATDDAVKRLEAKGVPAAKVAEFRSKAGRLQTPEQVGVLEAGY